ncbi:MAG TPA: hypothetical protein VKQ30_03170 [Ktedonobacterales bacterium]|nr:hypothetical protein [Ktedonobacterales bacterium]
MPTVTTNYQRDRILALLREHPTWSNADIAAQVPGARARAVANYRAGRQPPARAAAAPQTIIDPTPPPSMPPLDSLADLDEPPPPPPGAEYQPLPEMDIRPHLHSGTSKLIDSIVPNLAEIATAVALRVAPEHVQPLIPSPQTAEVMIAAPCRIVARHSHLKVDDMSEDARDISAILMAMGAWAVEIRANYNARAEWLASQNGAMNGHQRANGAGPAHSPAGVPDAGGHAATADSSAAWLNVSPTGGMAAEKPGGNVGARRDGSAVATDPATAGRLMAGLYSADADGRRRLGLG